MWWIQCRTPDNNNHVQPSPVAVPSTTIPPTTVVPQSPRQISQLRISPGPSGVAAGNIGQAILFTNLNEIPCTMSGYPGVAALNSSTHPLGL
jgi:Protein of unknown function (DUF4232)